MTFGGGENAQWCGRWLKILDFYYVLSRALTIFLINLFYCYILHFIFCWLFFCYLFDAVLYLLRKIDAD